MMEFKGAVDISQKIVVIGKPTEDAVRFDINLNCATGNIALHIAIRLKINGVNTHTLIYYFVQSVIQSLK